MNLRTRNEIKKKYTKGDLVPIIGAGCSIPFGTPSWYKLIQKIYTENLEPPLHTAIEKKLNGGLYWSAINDIKFFGDLSEQEIQEIVEEEIRKVKFDSGKDNNLKDLAEMNFKIYLTMNYDNFMDDCLNTSFKPICLSENTIDSYKFLNREEKQVFHLHGNISNPGTIIFTEESYNKLYNQKLYTSFFNLIGAAKSFLFIGASFDDIFISKLIENNVEIFRNKGYILLDKSQECKFKELKGKYNLNILDYDSSKYRGDHVLAIREILDDIKVENHENPKLNKDDDVIGVSIKSKRREEVEENLFYKKLTLENITPSLISLSKSYFIAAEKYIYEMKKQGISLTLIEKLLNEVFIKYQEQLVEEYEENKDSSEFVKKVHKYLKEESFLRFMKGVEESKIINNYEKQGLIHNLADDSEQDIWWGNSRIIIENGDEKK